MIKCICIDSENKPEEIPQNEWIEKGNYYHITHVYYHPMQGVQGVELKEVRLTDKSYPYKTYSLKRFAFKVSDIPKLIELIKNCNDLNSVDVNKLLEECELETIEK